MKLFHVLTWTVLAQAVFSWDTNDLELFDLVEEVNQNFYEFLGVPSTALSSEIRKAYRRLSLSLHPDKSKEEDAEVKFRQLVGIYEVLKDEEKRKRYHLVLENGLPDWRQPIFYYRRVRKMGLMEFFAVIFVITTVGQYIVMWAVYVEKKFTLSENFGEMRDRAKSKNRKARQQIEEQIDTLLEAQMEAVPRPRVSQLWPIILTVFTVMSIITAPQKLKKRMEEKEERRKREEEEARRILEEEIQAKEEKSKPRCDAALNPTTIKMAEAEAVVYTDTIKRTSDDDQEYKQVKIGEWTDEEIAKLAKAANKFPGGTPNRWQKIADMVGRPAEEVISRCQKMKDNHSMTLSTTVQGGVGKSKRSQAISDDIISQKTVENVCSHPNNELSPKSDSQLRKRNKIVKKTDDKTSMVSNAHMLKSSTKGNNSSEEGATEENSQNNLKLTDDSDDWNKNQQTILEWALRQYPKGTDQRWEKIAQHLPGKSKEDCIYRYKYLVDLVKKKKEQTSKKE
ncbi:dnaJ homolog subfamily C member 1-like [Ostrea edulis]|uniref:dnaJ homolog subfamily C member 1-like n=1 Tax=Ostrea edulis TaxID=37623 RepID=UPI0020956770|nr:dnaJ homolog subfamily C member 1-like [Ostrea edulis]